LFSPNSREAIDQVKYDLIVVGSGNGACGFLNHYLKVAGKDVRVLVLERGQNFFFTSDLAHQDNWTKSYSEGSIFKLHNTRTKDDKPILSGGACTMGGGGSINYTMIHEATSWLVKHLGGTEEYWNHLKKKLNKEFNREDPTEDETPITTHIIEKGIDMKFAAPRACSRIENIPNLDDSKPQQLYQFPTQFNTFGQRTNSGVSIVNWEDDRLRLETDVQVEDFEFASNPMKDGAHCLSVIVTLLITKESKTIVLNDGGKVILCCGAATPWLLMKQKELQQNTEIGKKVNDHFALPLGIYVCPPSIKVSPKDIYGPIFATTLYDPDPMDKNLEDQDKIVVSMDFFTGNLQKLLYLTSHLFLAFLLPNPIKRVIWTTPWLFTVIKTTVRLVVSVLNFFMSCISQGNDPEFITAIVKYNPAVSGHYENRADRQITLGWFEHKQDKKVAKESISDALDYLENLGEKPPGLVQWLYRLATKAPYNKDQIDEYIDNYSKNSLLSEQHLAGGCLLDYALEKGEKDRSKTGKVKGSHNLYVADLSAVPLPRVSPQMTAYLVGFHVANQLYPKKM
jgi:hypothetical protein